MKHENPTRTMKATQIHEGYSEGPEPVVVPDVEINGDIPNEGPDLVNVNDQVKEELNGEVLPQNEIGNVNAPIQNEMAKMKTNHEVTKMLRTLGQYNELKE